MMTSDEKKNSDDAIIAKALQILARRMKQPGHLVSSPSAVKEYLTLKLAQSEREIFAVLYLDVRNRVIAYEELFTGTLTQTSVYPREVVKAALRYNAASVIYCHNHPSGVADPSEADKLLTRALQTALETVDIRSLDHIIIGGVSTYSFAEYGLI
jgi:DNA repair protein RadC